MCTAARKTEKIEGKRKKKKRRGRKKKERKLTGKKKEREMADGEEGEKKPSTAAKLKEDLRQIW